LGERPRAGRRGEPPPAAARGAPRRGDPRGGARPVPALVRKPLGRADDPGPAAAVRHDSGRGGRAPPGGGAGRVPAPRRFDRGEGPPWADAAVEERNGSGPQARAGRGDPPPLRPRRRMKLRLGARGSALSLAQADLVAKALAAWAEVEIVKVKTTG